MRSLLEKAEVADAVRRAFARTPYPGDPFLVGSRDGCEPAGEVGPFEGRTNREALDPAFLDQHYSALSFFSEGAFRFFLPAYLLADLDEALDTADPVFHLTHGFSDTSVAIDVGGRTLVQTIGRSVPINPRRFGAMTSHDYARYRLSVFCREEAQAIVAYLEFTRDTDDSELTRRAIDAALDAFWRARAATAPTADELEAHVAAAEAYAAALRTRRQD